ncbi:MAG: GDSL-type esterase/lipase family protein, partial [Verrucomicrobiaceae bacterium]
MKRTRGRFNLTIGAAALMALLGTSWAQQVINLGTIMPVGDSITKGAPAGAYRDPLFTLLKNGGCSFKFVGRLTENPTAALTADGQEHHEGHSGMGMNWIDEHLKEFFAANQPDRILLAIGANDIGGAAVPELKNRMDRLVTDIFALQPKVTLYLASVTPQTGPAMEKIVEFNKLIPGIVADHKAKGRKVIFVSMETLELKDIGDNVHPNVSGS